MLSQLSYIPTKVCAFAQGNSLPDFETIVNRFAYETTRSSNG